jgi:hypothetical protein
MCSSVAALLPADAYEVMAWLQPHVARLLAESEFVLEAVGQKKQEG